MICLPIWLERETEIGGRMENVKVAADFWCVSERC
jgi:hypothetical protein